MNEKKSLKTQIGLAVILIIIAMLALYAIGPFLFRGMASDNSTPTVEGATEAPPATEELPGPSFDDPFESTGAEDSPDLDPDNLRVGRLEIEYPPFMTTRSSETVVLYVYVPLQTASAGLADFERITISLDPTGSNENLFSFSTLTVLYDSMRASLRSTSFKIEPLRSDEPQFVDINTPETPTTWEWIIQAPDFPGEQVIAASIYLGEDTQPSWVGSIKIDVRSPVDTPHPTPTITPSPTPTLTPVPVLARIGNQIIDGISIEVCLGIPALILAIFAVMDQLKKRMKKRKKKATK